MAFPVCVICAYFSKPEVHNHVRWAISFIAQLSSFSDVKVKEYTLNLADVCCILDHGINRDEH